MSLNDEKCWPGMCSFRPDPSTPFPSLVHTREKPTNRLHIVTYWPQEGHQARQGGDMPLELSDTLHLKLLNISLAARWHFWVCVCQYGSLIVAIQVVLVDLQQWPTTSMMTDAPKQPDTVRNCAHHNGSVC
jgi:hypothetical protein